jgi:hypothetical protein
MALGETNPLPKAPFFDKDHVGKNQDEIRVKSRKLWLIYGDVGVRYDRSGRTEVCQMLWTPSVKWSLFLHMNSDVDILGLVGFV